jgi:hypothetical protein
MRNHASKYTRHGLLAALALLLGSLAARAYDTSWIAPGRVVSSSSLKAALDEAQSRIASLEAAAKNLPTVTAWTSWTPILHTSSSSTALPGQLTNGRWRRVGDSIEIRIMTSITASTGTSEVVFWDLPILNGAQLQYDPTKVVNGQSDPGNPTYGQGYVFSSSTQNLTVLAVPLPRTPQTAVTAWATGTGSFVNANLPVGSTFSLSAVIPIQGWGIQ